MMYYTNVTILNNVYYLGYDDVGITFVGSPNHDKSEIYQWFKNVEYKKNGDIEKQFELELSNFLLHKSKDFKIKYNLYSTPFQNSVYNEVLKIEYGKTKTYQEIALSLGDKKKVRAVANAIGKNPLLFIIPCHRVIGSDNSLKGFRAGLKLKEELLILEKQYL